MSQSTHEADQVCVLCQARLQEKYRVVFEDDLVFALMNNSPLKDGHVIILPVRHAHGLSDLTAEEAKALLQLTDRCVRAAEKLSSEPAITALNSTTHRTELHLHLHVVPSKAGLRGLLAASEGVEHRILAEPAKLEALTKAFRSMFA